MIRPSPVYNLTSLIESAISVSASDRTDALHGIVGERITLFYDNLAVGFVVSVAPEAGSPEVRISTGALQLVWATSYMLASFIRTSRELVSVDQQQSAIELFRWANDQVRNRKLSDWPCNLPEPVVSQDAEGLIYWANLVFQFAIGWIILHEVGHCVLGHGNKIEGAAAHEERRKECQADAFATEWMRGDANGSGSAQHQRELGILAATATLIALDLVKGSFETETYPASYSRLHDSIDPCSPVTIVAGAFLFQMLKSLGFDHSSFDPSLPDEDILVTACMDIRSVAQR
jgi:hypothetical protein